VLCPIRDREILVELRDFVLGAYLRDTQRAMVLDASGAYHRARTGEPFDAQAFLISHYARGTGD
jgi:hypothetical protein